MIITIDGLSGAGKTTQANILSERLGIPVRGLDVQLSAMRSLSLLMTNGSYDSSVVVILQMLTMLRTMSQEWGNFILVDHFFRTLIQTWQRREDRIDEVLDLFQSILTCFGGEEPIASFYLHMDGELRERRRFYREANDCKTYQLNRVELSVTNSEDRVFLNLCEYLRSKIPYLHIIDGNQAEEGVSSDIWGILKEIGVAV